MSGVIMPDIEAMVLAYLRDDDAVAALVADRCYQSLPAEATFPLLVAFRLPGRMRVRHLLDEAHIQIDAWSKLPEEDGSRDAAHDAMAAARAAVLGMVGQFEMGTVTGVDERRGPMWFPDPVSSRPRYVFEVAVFASAATLVSP